MQVGIDYPKTMADVFEAVAGAVYMDLDRDISKFRQVYRKIMNETIGK